jgi:hypothetical protein
VLGEASSNLGTIRQIKAKIQARYISKGRKTKPKKLKPSLFESDISEAKFKKTFPILPS